MFLLKKKNQPKKTQPNTVSKMVIISKRSTGKKVISFNGYFV